MCKEAFFLLNEYQFKRKLSWGFEIIQLVLLTVCIYSSFVVMPYVVSFLEEWRPQLESPLAVRIVAADTSKVAEIEKQQIAKEVIQTVENSLPNDLSTVDIYKIVHDELLGVDELQTNYYKWRINEQIIPPKLINGVIYPQQIHKTIQVDIEEARGDNFFCAVFPNVCIREDKEDKEEKEKVRFKWFDKIFREEYTEE